jgi:UDP-N-acetylglucosamine 2-epimerase (non-hydrolysing)/GDP/UDP-N,N'-diacetylbacillosamine 2-epimerase (hydrolysing)
MTALRKICVVTGSRADYGLLYWLLREILDDSKLTLQLVVTGMHLSPEFGLTHQKIERDGFTIDEKVEMLISSDSAVGVAKSIGLGTIGFADAFYRLKPDILVVLGDRFEILAAAQTALVARIPIAHISGGETTEGAFDEAIRHAITKMSQWHYVTTDEYRKRVIQLGEFPDRVFNFGAPGLDHLQHIQWLGRAALEANLGILFTPTVFLVTFHPPSLGDQDPLLALNELLTALDNFPEATVIFTAPNADTGGRTLLERIVWWTSNNEHRSKLVYSLGQERYLSLLREASIMIGNSSSGFTEAPALKRATVNIGDRQKGRTKASSIIDATENKDSIVNAIRKALSPAFQAGLPLTNSPHGSGNNVSRCIKESLKTVTLGTRKTFFDLKHTN